MSVWFTFFLFFQCFKGFQAVNIPVTWQHVSNFGPSEISEGSPWAIEGNCFIRQTGEFSFNGNENSDSIPNGKITSIFPTKIGNYYYLSYQSGTTGSKNGNQILELNISSKSIYSQTFLHIGGITVQSQYYFVFKATEEYTQITFSDLSKVTDGIDLLLDKIKCQTVDFGIRGYKVYVWDKDPLNIKIYDTVYPWYALPRKSVVQYFYMTTYTKEGIESLPTSIMFSPSFKWQWLISLIPFSLEISNDLISWSPSTEGKQIGFFLFVEVPAENKRFFRLRIP